MLLAPVLASSAFCPKLLDGERRRFSFLDVVPAFQWSFNCSNFRLPTSSKVPAILRFVCFT